MATTVATLEAKLVANTSGLSSGLNKAEKEVSGFAKKTKSGLDKIAPAVKIATLAGAAAVGTFAVKSVSAFADFEKGMNEVFTLMPGASEKAMGDMEDDVKALSKEMGITTDKVVPALYQSISAGVPQENVFEFMELASMAAVGGVTELETAVDGLTSVTNAYGLDVISAQEASDIMFTTVRLGKTTMDELSRSLFQVTPVAASLGVEFTDVSAALAAMTAQGTPTSVAATNLRGALVELGKEGTIAFNNFTEATGTTFPAFIESGGDVQGAFDAMKLHADDMGVGVGDLFGSVEAGMSVIQLTSEAGSKAFGTALGEMDESAGATQTAFETMNEGLSRTWDKIKAKVGVALIEVGERLAPFVQQFSDWFVKVLPGAIETTIGFVEKAVDWFGNFVRGGQAIFDFFKKLPGPMQTVAKGLGLVSLALMALYANPIIAGLALVAGAVALLGEAAGAAEERILAIETALNDVDTAAGEVGPNLEGALRAAVEEGGIAEKSMQDLGISFEEVLAAMQGGSESFAAWLKGISAIRDTGPKGTAALQALEKKFKPLTKAMDDWEADAEDAAAGYEGSVEEAADKQAEETERMVDSYAEFAAGMAYHLDASGLTIDEFTGAVETGRDDVSQALADSQYDWQRWEEEFGGTATAILEKTFEVTSGMVTMWGGATEQVEISVEDMLKNLEETAAEKQRFEQLMTELMNAGMTGLANELATKGPAVLDAIETLASDSSAAWEAELYLNPSSAIAQLAGNSGYQADMRTFGRKLGASAAAGFTAGFGTINVRVPTDPRTGITAGWDGGDDSIPKDYAKGGVITSETYARMGEAGEPEAVVPLSRAEEFGFGGGSGGGDVNVYVDGSLFGASDVDELVELIEDGRRQLRLRGGVTI